MDNNLIMMVGSWSNFVEMKFVNARLFQSTASSTWQGPLSTFTIHRVPFT
jgi:hypothetical protein